MKTKSSSADYGLKTERGPLCYVGTFGSNAPLGEVIPSPPLTSDKNYAYLAGKQFIQAIFYANNLFV